MQVKKQQLELDMEQRIGSKLGKEYVKAVYCHAAYLTSLQSAVLCWVAQSCPTLCNPMDCSPPGSSVNGEFSRQEYWSRLPCPPPGDLPNLGIKPRSPFCRQILYHLSHKGSPGILERVAYPFSRGYSQPRNWTEVSCIAGGLLPTGLSGKLITTRNLGRKNIGTAGISGSLLHVRSLNIP